MTDIFIYCASEQLENVFNNVKYFRGQLSAEENERHSITIDIDLNSAIKISGEEK